MEKKEKLFTWDFLVLFFAAGLMRVCYQMQNTMMPLYGKEIGLSATQIGAMAMVCTIFSLALRPLIGGLLDRVGRKKIVIFCTALFALATFLCGFFQTFAILLVFRAMQGLGFSGHTTAVNTLATDVMPEKRLSEGIGYMGLTSSISHAIAPALAIYLAAGKDWDASFLYAALAGAAAVLCLAAVKERKLFAAKGEDAPGETPAPDDAAHFFWEKTAVKPAVLMLFIAVCQAGLTTFLATYALEKGFSSAQVAIYFTVNACATAAARLLGGKIRGALSTMPSIFFASVLCFAAFLIIPLTATPFLLWTAAALQGLGYGVIYPILNAEAVIHAPVNRRGTAMATFLTGMDIGGGFGATLWGAVIDFVGMNMMFYLCAAITACTYVVMRITMSGSADASRTRNAAD